MGNKATVTKSGVKLGVVSGGRRSDAVNVAAAVELARPVPMPTRSLVRQAADETVAPDHFVERNGVKFAGVHLLIELWGASNLGDMDATDKALRDAASVSGATLLHIHLHHFGAGAGLSGVAVLAESHISIHTWPERGYAALDIFMCGACDPYKAIPVLRGAFKPETVQISEQKRGVIA